jgi:hypothetical protein
MRSKVFPGAGLFPWFLLALLFFSRPIPAEIIITEIHYAPVDTSGVAANDLEFVEIFNDGPEPYDLLGYHFTNGIDFEFSARTILEGRSYLVVCRNVTAVKAAYGITNAMGNFSHVLDNAGETIELSNPAGAAVCKVSYNDRGKWPSGAKGTGHTLSLLNPYTDPSDPDNWAISTQMGGTPGAANFGGQASFQDTIIIDSGETWKYFKGTQEPSNPVTAWRQVGFNDAAPGWLSGATGIGYGDGDDATILNDMQMTPTQAGYLTIFCRKTFTVANVSQINSLVLGITYDDGFFAYLNGTQVASRNVTAGAFDSPASSAIEPTQEDIDISSFKSSLVNGVNVLAVQVHNANLPSSDLSFIPKLVSRKSIPPSQIDAVPVVINEGYCRASSGRFIELYNTSTDAVNLSGYYLSDDFATLKKFTVSNGTTIPAHGFLSLTEAQLGFDLSIVPGTKERVSIAITNPAGTRVIDAVIFEPKVVGKSEARVPNGARELAAAANPTPGASNTVSVQQDVIFNEIMYHPLSGDDLDEYIELYNRGSSAVDLSSWFLEGVDRAFPQGSSISAGAYLVVARDPSRIQTRYGLPASAVLSTAWLGFLKDGGERLKLLDANGNVVDTVHYRDGGDWTPWPDGGGSSLERIDPASESDAAGSWDASDDSSKAAMQAISYGPVPYGGGESDFGMMLAEEGIMLIDDISLVPSTGGASLISNGNFNSSTAPWRIEGTHIRSGRTTDPSELLNGAGTLKLICWNGSGDYKVNRIETDTAAQTAGTTYNVSFKARWVVGSPRVITIGDYNVGQPQNPGLAGSNLVQVPTRLGTPGAINSATTRQIARTGSDNVGPAIDQVHHSPGVPESSEPVTVFARVRDNDGVSAVGVFYRTETPAGAFTQVDMTDPDGDGVYTATIPGQALNTRVLFYVEAADGAGANSRFPADPVERTHPPVLNPSSPSPNDSQYCMYRHDTRIVSTTHHSYRFVLNQINESYLLTRKVHSNEMIDGTFIFGGTDVYYNSQVRFAGSPWLRQSNSFDNSYSIKMPKGNPLHGRKKAFNLDEHGSDGKERISHYLLRQSAGSTLLPYWDFHALVQFQLNGVKNATFEALDKPNSEYISSWFPDAQGGAFFEMDDRFSFNDNGDRTGNADGRVLYPSYGGTTGGRNKENYRWFFNPRANLNEDSFQTFEDLCLVMDQRVTPNSSFDTLVYGQLDVEEVLRVWAVEMNIDDWDTWGGRRGKNCYFYQSPADGLWRLVPWDLELTYGDVNAFGLPATPSGTYTSFFSEIQRMINRPLIKRRYYGMLAEAVDTANGFFHSTFLSPFMQRLQAAGVGSTGIGQAGGWIDSRAGLIRSWIQSAVYPRVRLQITTNGGNPFAASGPAADLQGDAPADVFFFVVSRNGVLLDSPAPDVQLSSSNMTGWSIAAIPLAPGVNTIEILGLGSKGNVVDQDSIQVTSSVNWNQPAISQVAPPAAAVSATVVLTGTDFHNGVRVLFGGTQATSVTFNEAIDAAHVSVVVPSGVAPGATTVKVVNLDGQESNLAAFTVQATEGKFIRGDSNLDSVVDISDGLKVLLYLFNGASAPCLDALDANDSGTVDITDGILILDYLFKGGAAPAQPFPAKGADPTTTDGLNCAQGLP